MSRITATTYKNDKYYKRVTKAVYEILKAAKYIAPVDVFMQIGNLSKEDYENWRFGRIPYLEKVIDCSLSKANRILRILEFHARECGLKPSQTVYQKWGKGKKVLLQFSKSGDSALETAYSTHYVVSFNSEKAE